MARNATDGLSRKPADAGAPLNQNVMTWLPVQMTATSATTITMASAAGTGPTVATSPIPRPRRGAAGQVSQGAALHPEQVVVTSAPMPQPWPQMAYMQGQQMVNQNMLPPTPPRMYNNAPIVSQVPFQSAMPYPQQTQFNNQSIPMFNNYPVPSAFTGYGQMPQYAGQNMPRMLPPQQAAMMMPPVVSNQQISISPPPVPARGSGVGVTSQPRLPNPTSVSGAQPAFQTAPLDPNVVIESNEQLLTKYQEQYG